MNCVVTFTHDNCILHDLSTKDSWELGKAIYGLYCYDLHKAKDHSDASQNKVRDFVGLTINNSYHNVNS